MPVTERWDAGNAYDRFMGRWSRRVAALFVERLGVPAGSEWLDVGCGTGALIGTIARHASPAGLAGVDPSPEFLGEAAGQVPEGTDLRVADARQLPFETGSFDAVVSGLVLNFVPDPAEAVAEMRRVTRPGGVVAAYVWDYAEGMGFLRQFWDAATELDPAAKALDEGRRRFPLCRPEPLLALFGAAELADVAVAPIDIATTFSSFDDYWQPFHAGQGPAGTYLTSLPAERREALGDRLRSRLPVSANGSIGLTARAWAVQGRIA